MTWKEFKDFVESKGVKDANKVGYIDFTCTCEEVEIEESGEFDVY